MVLGRGSLCLMQDSISFLATSSAISSVSAMVLPCAIAPEVQNLLQDIRPHPEVLSLMELNILTFFTSHGKIIAHS